MHGRGPWSMLVLLGTLTTLPALGWIGPSHPTGRNGVHDAAADGFFSFLTSLAAPVSVPLAPAASAPEPRGPTGAIPSPPAG